MRVRRTSSWVWVAVLGACLSAACASSKEPAAQVRAREYTQRFYAGDLVALHRLFTPEMASEMSFEQFSEVHRSVTEQLGAETEVLSEALEVKPPYQRYVRRARFERHAGEIEISWLLRDDHSIAGVVFRPAEAPGRE